MAHSNLAKAKKNKNDEFYTRLEDIEKEVFQYKPYFKGKTVYCNCDDSLESNFFKYFARNFEFLGLKKLITTCYNEGGRGRKCVYTGDKNGNYMPDLEEIEIEELEGDGDFRSAECIELLKESDIVASNPPFSLFREYLAQLVEYDKKFLIIGNKNALSVKSIFPLIKENKMWIGYRPMAGGMWFTTPKGKQGKVTKVVDGVILTNQPTCWFTNMKHNKRNLPLYLFATYSPDKYPKYDNYDAIECPRVSEIPYDYDGVMGVPITFLDKYNPNQFEIIKFRKGDDDKDLSVNGKCPYFRILIRNKHAGELVWD